MKLPLFQLYPLPPVLPVGITENSLALFLRRAWLLLLCSLQSGVYIHCWDSSWICSSPGWAVLALCLSLYDRCSKHLIVFVAVGWTHSSLSVFLVVSPQLDPVLQMSHQCWVGDHLLQPAGNAFPDASQDAAGYLCHKVPLLAHVQDYFWPCNMLGHGELCAWHWAHWNQKCFRWFCRRIFIINMWSLEANSGGRFL